MANLLSRFNKGVVGSESKLGDYKSKISSVGDFRRIKDIQVILNSWSNILTTPRRSYMFDPEYGSDLYRMIFEPADEVTEKEIIDETVASLQLYDDRATINNVSVQFLDNQKGFSIAIDVSYQGDTGQLEVLIDEDTYFQFFESTTGS
jgi:phage baseplate assembly protein W